MRTGTRRRRRTLASRPGEGIGQRATLACSDMELRTVPRAARRSGRELAAPSPDRGGLAPVSPRRGGSRALPRVRAAARPGAGTSSSVRLLASSASRGIEIESNRCLGADARMPLQLVQLRLRAASAVRPAGRARWCTGSTGPIGVYRGFDDGTDGRIAAVNDSLADATVLQSRYSLEKHLELGLELRDPVVIPNAVDPAIFHPPERREPLDGRKVEAGRRELVGQPAKGRRDARVARSQPRPGALRADLRRASSGPVRAGSGGRAGRLGRGGRALSQPRPLRRSEQGRSLLERAPGSARLRTAGGVPRERRPPGARRRGRASVPSRRGASGRARPARRGDRGAPGGDLHAVDLRRRRPLSRTCCGLP